MRVLLQRVKQASVAVEGEVIAEIGDGLLLLVGIGIADTQVEVDYLAAKIANLRVFPDDAGRMNRSVLDAGGEVLVVSQFTLFADARKGRRPSFTGAAAPDEAVPLLAGFVERLRGHGARVSEGRFGAMMDVALINDGPVTIWLDTAELVG